MMGVIAFAGAQPRVNPPGEIEPYLLLGREAAQNLLKTLRARLKEVYRKDGVAQAVAVCADEGQDFAKQIRAEYGLGIKRVSLKARNPKNQPDAWERSVLLQWETAQKNKKPIQEVWRESGRGEQRVVRYMMPITIGQKLCLECHGTAETIKPETRAMIRKYYPNDTAQGYTLNAMRGAVSVTLAAP
jgi:hypothetical protein